MKYLKMIKANMRMSFFDWATKEEGNEFINNPHFYQVMILIMAHA